MSLALQMSLTFSKDVAHFYVALLAVGWVCCHTVHSTCGNVLETCSLASASLPVVECGRHPGG